MAFSNFTLAQVAQELGVEIAECPLFEDVPPAAVSPWLAETLHEFAPLALAIDTEKAKSEFIIAPVLLELKRNFKTTISLFSGVVLSVDRARGLEGICDFVISGMLQQFYLTAPIFAVVEAKKDDIMSGLGQCIATIYAAALFNKQADKNVPFLYGTVTNGQLWRFIKLEKQTAYIDTKDYYIEKIELLMGVLNYAVQTTKSNS